MSIAQPAGLAFRCSNCRQRQPAGAIAYRRDLEMRCAECGPFGNPALPLDDARWHVRLAVAQIICCWCGRKIEEDDLVFYQTDGSTNLRCETCGVEASTT